ncbi:MAG: inositol monophosphatase [Pseudomonadota bacterium]
MSLLPSPDKVAALVEAIADEVIMPSFQGLSDDQIHWKSAGDPVTEIDLATERELRKALGGLIPGAVLVGEEGEGKSIGSQDDDYVWLIDPIDGTRNFIEGSVEFCSMVALIRRGECVLAVIHAPRRGITALAERGSGATLGDGPLRLDPIAIDGLDDHELVGQINFMLADASLRDDLRKQARARFQRIDKLRCAGLDLVDQAQAKRHFSVYRNLWSWDHAPGVLVLCEAGGAVTILPGFQAYQPLARVHGIVTASSPSLAGRISEMMQRQQI